MPIINGRISDGGAIVDVLVGVSQRRSRNLSVQGFKVPPLVHVRALIDSGASLSGFAPRVFVELDLEPVDRLAILTPSTLPSSPHEFRLFDVSLSLTGGGRTAPFPDLQVMEADCWLPDEGIEALLGRDILDLCFFQYHGPSQTFTLAY